VGGEGTKLDRGDRSMGSEAARVGFESEQLEAEAFAGGNTNV